MPILRAHACLSAAIVLVAAASAPVAAQLGAPAHRAGEERKAPQPPVTLEDLYERLKTAEDAAEAKGIAALIGRRLARSGSATVDLLSDRARQAMM